MIEINYNPNEMLICTASRLMSDNSTAFIGTGIPMLAASLAQKMHAPNLMTIFEFGGMGAILDDLPVAVGGRRSFHKALSALGILDVIEWPGAALSNTVFWAEHKLIRMAISTAR